MAEVSPRIWIAIRSYARDDDHARDLLQGSWHCILDRLDRYGGRGSFANWAVAVARNFSRMQLRKAKREGAMGVPLEEHPGIQDRAPGPEEDLFLQEERERVYRALDRLPDRERDAIVLKVLEEKDTDQIARALDVTPESARAILRRAMSRLRKMALKGELFTDRS